MHMRWHCAWVYAHVLLNQLKCRHGERGARTNLLFSDLYVKMLLNNELHQVRSGFAVHKYYFFIQNYRLKSLALTHFKRIKLLKKFATRNSTLVS